MYRSITRPWAKRSKWQSHAAGDLSQNKIEGRKRVETGQLLQALKDTNENLRKLSAK